MFRQAVILAVVGLALAAPSSKLDQGLAASLKSKSAVNIFVSFQGGNKPAIQEIAPLQFTTRGQKVTHLVSNLKTLAEKSQAGALKLLQGRSSNFKQYWVSNELYVKGASAQLINELASLPEVAEIREERIITLDPFTLEKVDQGEWNLEKIEAEAAWALIGESRAERVVVANIDTGVRASHEALRDNYRESYGWFDAYDRSSSPSDVGGHGTHTMGLLAGKRVGVAPVAQWIACKGCDETTCTEETLVACGQWTLCPTQPNGEDEDCSKAPQVVSNSWGGGQGVTFFNQVIDAWKAADIVPVFATGNAGPECGTANSPGDQDVIAVGATDSNDSIADFSSAGPSVDGKLKPDLSAPGVNIRSAWGDGDNAYSSISGTSMAAPQVAGAAALLLTVKPDLTYNQVKTLLEVGADTDLADTGRTCGGIPSTQFPNNQYGAGRINLRRSIEAALNNA